LNVLAADSILLNDVKNNKSPLKADVDVLISMISEKGISQRAEALSRRRNVLNLRQGFAAMKKTLDQNEEIKLFNAHSDLAYSFLEYNDYLQAERLFELCRQKYLQWSDARKGDLSYEWAKYYNSRAQICMLRGDYEEAVNCAIQAMSLNAQMGNRTGYLMWTFLLASIYLQQGKTQLALKTHLEVLRERRERGGRFNEGTLESCYAVGAIYEQTERNEEAEKYFRESLKDSKAANWCEEGVARSRYHLANIMTKRGKPEKDADRLRTQAQGVLYALLQFEERPAWLVGETDEVILFDHLRSYRARFTGTGLLKRFQKEYKPGVHTLSPINVDEMI